MRATSYSPCGVKRYVVQCECGREEVKNTSNIRRAKEKNTGCSVCGRKKCDKARETHGESNTPLHKIWMWMRSRCNCPSSTNYKWYGGKGIKVCDEWNDFVNFRDWATSNGYSRGLTIDRRDPCGNYEPSNCRWLTQSDNSKLARGCEIGGEEHA